MALKAQYKLINPKFHCGMGNVRAVITDRKFIKDKSLFMAELVTASDSVQCHFEAYQNKVQNPHWRMPISKSLKFGKSELIRIRNRYYYAFGSPLYGRNYTAQASGYRFGFNTQKKVDEVSGDGNHNTAEFWEYDTRLGRRWNRDPKPNPAISDYVCFGNNPILNSDLKGDTIKPIGKEAQKLNNDYNAMISFKISEYKILDRVLQLKGADADRTKLKQDYQEFFDAEEERLELESDEQVYDIAMADGGVFGAAETMYDKSNRHVVAFIDKNSKYDIGTLANEMKHFSQYKQQEISFNWSNGKPGALFDFGDEFDATRREFAFIGKKVTDSEIENHIRSNKYHFMFPGKGLNINSKKSDFQGMVNTVDPPDTPYRIFSTSFVNEQYHH